MAWNSASICWSLGPNKKIDMNKTTIVLDLDDTLINTSLIKSRIFSSTAKAGLGKEECRKVYVAFRRKHLFEPDGFIQALGKAGKFTNRRDVRKDIKSVFTSRKFYNFPGAKGFLKKLSRHHDLVMLTYGSEKFQKLKIRQSGLRPYFKKIIITGEPDKKNALKKLASSSRKGIVLIDNSMAVVKSAKSSGIAARRLRFGANGRPDYNGMLGLLAKLH
jgi:FMN phosphatase YigB (HAD superfamily)